jgi:transcriptional antiterminator
VARENPWVRVNEVRSFFDCSRAQAYKIIKQLNTELNEKGYLTYAGRVSRRYFNERYYSI